MDFETKIYTNKARTMRSGLVDQGGNLYAELPPGATIDYSSDNPAVCNPTPLPGGVSARLNSGDVGTCTVKATFGGTLQGPAFAERTGTVEVVHSEPAGAQLSVGDEEDETPPAPPEG